MKRAWIIFVAVTLSLVAYLYFARQRETALRDDSPSKRVSFSPADLPVRDIADDLEAIPESKREAVKLVLNEFQAEMKRRITPGVQDGAGLQELEKLQRELDSRLKELLTTGEKFEYDLKSSMLAQEMMHTFLPMEPSDSEFRAIFKHRSEFENRTGDGAVATDGARTEMENRIRQSLGEVRFEQYKMVNDPDFKKIYHFFHDERVEPEQLTDLYRTWSAAGDSADKIRVDDALSAETKRQRLKELAQKTHSAMEQILGTGPGSEKFKVRGSSFVTRIESLETRKRDQSTKPTAGLFYIFPK